jgi:hypothetical protein
MKKQSKAEAVTKLLNKGASVRAIKGILGVSESYVYMVKKKLEDIANEAIATTTAAVKETILSVDNTMYPDITPEFAFSLSQGRQKRKEAEAIDELLNERGSKYGSFIDVAQIAQEMKDVIRGALDEQNASLQADHQEALDMITSKIARIVNGDANHRDSWIDIAGYATLVAERLEGKAR